jgi:hypothetical protein
MLCLPILPQVSRGLLTLQRVSLLVNEGRRLNDSQSVATRPLPTLGCSIAFTAIFPSAFLASCGAAAVGIPPHQGERRADRIPGDVSAAGGTADLDCFWRRDLGSCVEPAEAENTPRPVQVLWIRFVVNARSALCSAFA